VKREKSLEMENQMEREKAGEMERGCSHCSPFALSD